MILYTIFVISLLTSFSIVSGNPELLLKSKIIDGLEAKRIYYPFLVEVSYLKNWQWGICGGSIISERYILTAAQCTYRVDILQIFVGSDKRHDGVSFVVNILKDIINHENFDPKIGVNDISLIKTPHQIVFNAKIASIKLPLIIVKSSIYEYLRERVITAGWGSKDFGIAKASPVLRYIVETVLDKEFCDSALKPLTANHICISSTDGKAPSEGDSGSPLILPADDVFGPTLIGIATSYYPRHKAAPAVYTRISGYLHWIKDHSQIAYY